MARLLIGLVATALALGAIVGAIGCSSTAEHGDTDTAPAAPGTEGPGVRGLLMWSERTTLSICVAGAADYALSETDVELVRQGLQDALATVDDIPAEYRDYVVTDMGCPPPVALIGKKLDRFERFGLDLPTRFISEPEVPSPYRVIVYFTNPGAYSASFGSDPYALTAEERACAGHVCYAVTEGIYVAPDATSQVLLLAFLDALALHQPSAQPTIDWQGCVQGTAEPWCSRYEQCRGASPDPSCDQFWQETGLQPQP